MFEEVDTQEIFENEQVKNEEIDDFFNELDKDIVLNKLESSEENEWYTSWYMIALYVVVSILALVLFIYLIKSRL